MARPNSEQKDQLKTAVTHVANTVMTNNTMPYVVDSADSGIDIAKQNDLVFSRNHSKGRMQDSINTIFHIIRRVYRWWMDALKSSKAILSNREPEMAWSAHLLRWEILGCSARAQSLLQILRHEFDRSLYAGYSTKTCNLFQLLQWNLPREVRFDWEQLCQYCIW